MTPRRFNPSDNRPRQSFGRSDRKPSPHHPHRPLTPSRLLRNFALSAVAIVTTLGFVAAEDRGWLGWDDGMRASWSSDPVTTPVAARAVPLCPPEYRRGGGGVTCITDGDSGVADGEPWRLTTRSGGVDAPEVGRPECAAERTAGGRATRRLQALMSGGYTMSGGSTDRHGRRLVTVTLADGRDAGQVLIGEGLAQPWPNSWNPWC